MARPAAHGCFLEALRPLQGLNHEGGLPKPPILVEPFAGKLSKRLSHQVSEEIAVRRIVQFPGGARSADGRLHVTLRANRDEFSIVDPIEVYRRTLRRFRVELSGSCRHHVVCGGPVTHFAIDAWLFEFQVIDVETTAFHISQLAGVADGANGLVAGGTV